MSASDTIYALSTGEGRAALSVFRISGAHAGPILDAMAGGRGGARLFRTRRIVNPLTGMIIDQAVTVWIPGPRSFTGEDCAELHVHASPAVQRALISALQSFPSVRLGEPGEFTRRAFINGKLDLVEAEGLGDLLSARTELQRDQALAQMLGQSSGQFEGWRTKLLEMRALIEAAVDFSDEESVASAVPPDVDRVIAGLAAEMEEELRRSSLSEAVRDGFRVVLAGHPNTGKSSLLNALARREAAIVSAIPGTTRDAIEVMLDVGGFPVILTDTAGLRAEAADAVEVEGIRRSLLHVKHADVLLWVTAPDVVGSGDWSGGRQPDMVVETKCDMNLPETRLNRNESGWPYHKRVSARTGEGIPELVEAISDILRKRLQPYQGGLVVSARQKEAILDSIRILNDSLSCPSDRLELKAEGLRRASDVIGRLTGRIDVEEWLGVIFSRFCVGK